MKSLYNLRLPPELCKIIELNAKENRLSINQYISYLLTKSISYNEAIKKVKRIIKNVSTTNLKEVIKKIPNKKPLQYDEI